MALSLHFCHLVYLFAVVSVVVQAGLLNHNSKTHYFELNITRELIDSDCSGTVTSKLVVNGQLVGPTIAVTTGDRVKMLVRNLLPDYTDATRHPVSSAASANGGYSNDITIHCHGIRQLGSPDADGVPFLSQDPIKPQQSFLHEFQVIDQAGTYFYHAHVGLHSETVFGALIVYESEEADPEAKHKCHKKLLGLLGGDDEDCKELVAGPYHYDDERTIILSEWWQQTAESLNVFTLGPNFTDIPESQSILINGRTIYEPEINAYGPECQGYSVISVDPEKTYRIRVIGANDYRTISFAIADHELTIIEVDGTLVQPFTVPYLEISPGQRFSVLLSPSDREGDYAINTIRSWIEPELDPASNGLAVLRYTRGVHGQDIEKEATTFAIPENLFDFPEDAPYWYWRDIAPVDVETSSALYKQEASRTITLRIVADELSTGETRWFVNNVTFIDPEKTILTSILEGERPLPRPDKDGYDPDLCTYPLEYMEVVDIVLQSTRAPDAPCRMHPWHTHGHSFCEIAFGPGRYQHGKHGGWRNVPHPFLRDVVSVYPVEDPEVTAAAGPDEPVDCGWAKIRIVADNPGIFPVHCHNSFHMIMGMMVVLEEAPERIAAIYNK
ncbi:Cupredoxin [Zychaea mexicana]|uniref:Cupredoxin n=1 Tax=Zychaea mexicana TaxID=64656 RepID=UPI0022FE2391|nr:Cupredoxin [Zychaea mexicana]KAI9472932.1 Cupredoxin [Zychaea mexicana]